MHLLLFHFRDTQFIEKQRSSALREEDYRQQSSDNKGNSSANGVSISSSGSLGKRQLTPLPFDENNAPKGRKK